MFLIFCILFTSLRFDLAGVYAFDGIAQPYSIERRTVTAGVKRTATTSAAPQTSQTSQSFSIPPDSQLQNKSASDVFELDLLHQKSNQNLVVPLLPAVSFGCRNCTTNGKVEVLTGNFSIDEENVFTPGDVLQDAWVTILLPDGFNAHIELGINVSASLDFDIPIIDIPISGFIMPGIGRAGLFFQPNVNVNFTLDDPIQLAFGFEVKMPQQSSMTVDFSGFNISMNSTGFNQTIVHALPASLNATISGSLTTSFQPQLVFGIELDPPGGQTEYQFGAEMRAVMNAPALTYALDRQVSVNNLKCAFSNGGLMDVFSTNVSYGMDLEAELLLPGVISGSQVSPQNSKKANSNTILSLLGIDSLPTASTQLFDKTILATSACVGEVRDGQTAAAVVVTSTTRSPTSSSTPSQTSGGQVVGQKKSAAGPFAVVEVGMLQIVALLLIFTLFQVC